MPLGATKKTNVHQYTCFAVPWLYSAKFQAEQRMNDFTCATMQATFECHPYTALTFAQIGPLNVIFCTGFVYVRSHICSGLSQTKMTHRVMIL